MKVLVYSKHGKDAFIERIPHNGMYRVARYDGAESGGRILCDTLEAAREYARAWVDGKESNPWP